MFEIVHSGCDGIKPPRLDGDAKRAIRSHAMRHFRRQQRQTRNNDNKRSRLLVPAQSKASGVDNGQASNIRLTVDENNNREIAGLEEASIPESISDSPSVAGGREDGLQIIRQPAGAAFYRYMLAETFGQSLIGSEIRRTRSSAILCYRNYVASTRSDLVQAVDDTVCLMLPGCILGDPRILLEGRKRCVAAVCHMQKALRGGELDIDGILASAIELLFVEIFKPVSLGMVSLYGGVVYLARTHLQYLKDSKTPVTGFVLVQLRQVMLLESLAARTPMPIGSEDWQYLLHASNFLPEMTENLMQLAVQLPANLNAAREVRHSVPTDPSALNHVLSDLLKLERSLLQWQVKHCVESSDVSARCCMARLSEKDRLLGQIGVTQSVEISQNVPFLTAQCQSLCYICLLLLRESVAGLIAAQSRDMWKHSYIADATRNAGTLCQLAEYFIQEADGLLSKALSIRAPLHFARRWYETNNDQEAAAWVCEKEAQIQKEVPFLFWESMLPLSLVSMYMHG